MRMPIFSYFLVVGSVLTGLLLWSGGESQPTTEFRSTQTAGIPKFKPEPEPEHARATTVNFAAEYKRPEGKPAKAAEAPARRKLTHGYSEPDPLRHFAEFPHDRLNIH